MILSARIMAPDEPKPEGGISYSAIKRAAQFGAHRYRAKTSKRSPALDLGHAVDAMLLGTPIKGCSMSTAAKARSLVERVNADPEASLIIRSIRRTRTRYMYTITDGISEHFGIAESDIETDYATWDMKTSRKDLLEVYEIAKYGYHVQAYIYQTVRALATGVDVPFGWICVSTEDEEAEVDVCRAMPDIVDQGQRDFEAGARAILEFLRDPKYRDPRYADPGVSGIRVRSVTGHIRPMFGAR